MKSEYIVKFSLIFFVLLITKNQAESQIIKSISRVSIDSSGRGLGVKNFNPNINGDGSVISFTHIAPGIRGGRLRETPKVRLSKEGITRSVAYNQDGVPANDGRVNDNGTFDSASRTSLSADGKLIAFASDANNLVPNDTNKRADIFVRNLTDGTIKRVNVTVNNEEAVEGGFLPRISANGKFVAFSAYSNNLVENDLNNELDVFVKNLDTGGIVKVPNQGFRASVGKISGDGRFVAYYICFSKENCNKDLNYPYLYDLQTGLQTPLTPGRFEYSHEISDNGNFAVIQSELEPGSDPGINSKNFTQVFLYNRLTNDLSLISVNQLGEISNSHAGRPDISADGRFVTFYSDASNLVEDDTNDQEDIFILDRTTGKVLRLNLNSSCKQVEKSDIAGYRVAQPVVSADGKFVAFTSLDRMVTRPISFNGFVQQADRDQAADVYLVEVDFDNPLPVFNPNSTAPALFLSLNCIGTEATFTFPRIDLQLGTTSRAAVQSAPLTRLLEISKVDGSTRTKFVRRLTDKRNELTIKNLKPGNYQVRYKNEVTSNEQKISDGFSELKFFTISNS